MVVINSSTHVARSAHVSSTIKKQELSVNYTKKKSTTCLFISSQKMTRQRKGRNWKYKKRKTTTMMSKSLMRSLFFHGRDVTMIDLEQPIQMVAVIESSMSA